MKKGIEYALIFTGGATLGFGVCGVKLISYALKDDDICDGIMNKITRKLTKTVYGDEAETGRQRSNKYTYKSYKKYCGENHESPQYDNIVFSTAADAENVLKAMKDIIKKYGQVSVADLFDVSDISPRHFDNKYGWTNIDDAKVIGLGNGYGIKLSPPLTF